jgi:hypothetical protein
MSLDNSKIDSHYTQAPIDSPIDELSDWVDSLPLLDTHKCAVMLFKALEALEQNVALSDCGERLMVLMLPIERISEAFVNDYVADANYTFNIRQAQLFFARELYLKLIDISFGAIERGVNKKELHVLCAINLLCFLKAIICGFQLSLSLKEGAWKKFYHVYKVMEDEGFLNKALNMSFFNIDSGMLAIDLVKLCILLVAGNPYQLNPAQIHVMYDICRRYASYAVITDDAKESAYSFDINQDLPPAWLNFSQEQKHDNRRYVDARPFINKLKENPAEVISYYNDSHVVLVKKLINSWNHIYIRNNQRTNLSNVEEISVISGLVSLHNHLNGEELGINQHQSSEKQVLHSQDRDQHGSVYTDQNPFLAYVVNHYEKILIDWQLDEESSGADGEVTNWDVVDMSDTGLKIVRGAVVNRAILSTGRLLGLQSKHIDEGTWQAGLIRWIRVDARHEVYMGIQLVSTQNKAVTLQNKNQAELGYVLPGIVTENCYLQESAQVIITPAIPYKAGDELVATDSKGEQKVRLNKCIDASRHHRIYTYQVID